MCIITRKDLGHDVDRNETAQSRRWKLFLQLTVFKSTSQTNLIPRENTKQQTTEQNVNLRWKHLFWVRFREESGDVQTNWHKMVILNQRIKAKTKKGQTTKAYIWLVDRYCLYKLTTDYQLYILKKAMNKWVKQTI